MIYEMQPPHEHLSKWVNSYWLIDSEGDEDVVEQKIVPDGYPETILHYGAPYAINLQGNWEKQPMQLLAGQIRHHFFLRNTGVSGMVGIKWQPTALTHLFGTDMSHITNQVVALPREMAEIFQKLDLNPASPEGLFDQLNERLLTLLKAKPPAVVPADLAVQEIINQRGNVEVSQLIEQANVSERQLERQFKRYVGLSPKFYSRIIRLGHIFELMQQGDKSWSDLVFDSGFYDQSHFIKNFKEFTGEDPGAYGFDLENMANFHLKK